MGLIETVIEATLNADGTLVLDEKPNLAPGRVTVVLRQTSAIKSPQPLGNEFFQMMEAIWAGQQTRNFAPRSIEDVESQRQQMRGDIEREIEAAIQLHNESRETTP